MKKLTLAIALLLVFSQLALARDFHFTQVQATYNISDNGQIRVTEEYSVDFNGIYHNGNRQIPMGTWNILHVSVFDETGRNLNAKTYTSNGYTQVDWPVEPRSGVQTFTLSYLLTNAITKYDDVDEFYWKLWGDEWAAGVDDFKAAIVFPKDITPAQLFLHSPAPARQFAEGNHVYVNAQNLPSHTFLETRVVMPKGIIAANSPFALRKYGKLRDGLVLDEEIVTIRIALMPIVRYWFIIASLALIAAFYYCYDKWGREPGRTMPHKVHEPPYPDKPWEVEFITTQNTSANSFKATILDLARRKYIEIAKDKPTGLIFKKDDFRFTKTDKLKNNEGSLHAIEKWAVDKFFDESDGTSVKASELAKNHAKDTVSMEQAWTDITLRDINAQGGLRNRLFEDRGRKEFNTALAIILGITTILLALRGNAWLYLFTPIFLVIRFTGKKVFHQAGRYLPIFAAGTLVAAGILIKLNGAYSDDLLVVSATAFALTLIDLKNAFILTRFSEWGEDRHEVWMGLKQYLNEMSRIHEKTPPEVALWEEYLVYATAMGNADAVIRAMKRFDISASEYSGTTAFVASSAFGSSFSSGFSSSTSSSSGGGGGFSGGGGGGGGGGFS